MNEKQKSFQEELKSLLEKYSATISWTCGECSDTHGIYDEKMIIYSDNPDMNLLVVEGSYISASEVNHSLNTPIEVRQC